jgi:hypothetical protein
MALAFTFHALNFVVLMLSNRRFRKEFKHLLFKGIKKFKKATAKVDNQHVQESTNGNPSISLRPITVVQQ